MSVWEKPAGARLGKVCRRWESRMIPAVDVRAGDEVTNTPLNRCWDLVRSVEPGSVEGDVWLHVHDGGLASVRIVQAGQLVHTRRQLPTRTPGRAK